MKMPRWSQLSETVNSWETSRRVLLLLGLLTLVYGGWQNLLMDPLQEQSKNRQARSSALQAQVNDLQARIAVLKVRTETDPNVALRQQAGQLDQQVRRLDRELRELTGNLLSPEQMAQAIESVLVQETPLRLLKLSGTGSELLLAAEPQSGADTASDNLAPMLYRHSMRLVFEGGYLETLDFLQGLEALPWRFSWDRLSLAVISHPTSRVTLDLSTLSLTPVWISL